MTAILPYNSPIGAFIEQPLFNNGQQRNDKPGQTSSLKPAIEHAIQRSPNATQSRFFERYQATQVAFSRDESVDIQLQTQDGDIITLSLRSSQSANYNTYSQSSNSNNRAFSARLDSFNAASATSLQIDIEGDLDQDELDAIDALLAQVNSIADDFFNDDIDLALEQALQLTFNSNEIASIAVDLSLQQTQQITQYYEQIQALGDGNKPPAPTNYSALEQLLEPLYARTANIEDSRNKGFIEDLLAVLLATKNLRKTADT